MWHDYMHATGLYEVCYMHATGLLRLRHWWTPRVMHDTFYGTELHYVMRCYSLHATDKKKHTYNVDCFHLRHLSAPRVVWHYSERHWSTQCLMRYIPSSVGTRVRHQSGNDVERYVIIIHVKLYFIFTPYVGAKFKHTYTGILFRKVAYTRYDVHWFAE
jgi:hypothetical protein